MLSAWTVPDDVGRQTTDAPQRPAGSDGGLFDTYAPKQDELFSVGEASTDNVNDIDFEAMREQLRERLDRYGIADRVQVSLFDSGVFGENIMGKYQGGGFIGVALNADQSPTFTFDHEVIHALRDMGLFTRSEWLMLSGRARSDKDLMKSVKRRYISLNEDQQVEEAVADLFADWSQKKRMSNTVARLFTRIRDVLRSIGQVLRGQGWKTPEDVMRAVAGGKIGSRKDVERFSSNAVSDENLKESVLDTARTAMLTGKASPFAAKAGDLFDRWRTAVQDRYLPLLRTQQAVEQQMSRTLTPEENPYLGEELMTGRIGAKLEKLSDEMVEPLLDMLNREDIEVEALESYLYARHAPERNAGIAAINPEFEPGEGSGMTDIEAAAIMARIERDGKTDTMKRLAQRVDDIRDWSLQQRLDAGLMSQDEADAWRQTYENYVPLRGKAETDGDSADSIRINRSGGGINVKGKESRMAYGRRSRADSILAYTILQAEESVVRGETNRVAQKFVEFAKSAPDGNFWEVNKVTRKPVMDQTTGIVRYEDQTRLQAEDKDWTVTAKFDGVEHRVTMNRDNKAARRLADSMRNLTQNQLGWITQNLGKYNRFLSAVNTSWNPEFLITNAFRDIQTAGINLAGVDQDKMVSGTLKDYRKAMVASVRGAFKSGKGGEWQRWYNEFISEGGRVYFNHVEDIEGIKKRIHQSFEMAAKSSKPGMNMLTVKRGFFAVRDFVEATNIGVENAIRLAAYKNARESGMLKIEAASLAKNLTVNFNRRGQMGPAINAAYLFFNASIQGSVRIFQAMKSKRVRKLLAGIAISGAMLELLNAMISGDDDDGEAYFDKISDFDKSRNLIIMVPGGEGEHVKIPLPYGYNVVMNGGRTLAEVARRGGDRWQESAANLLQSFADSFNPVGGTESLLNFVSPTILDPVVDIQQNKNFTGGPIMPDQNQFGPEVPDAQRYYASVGPQWRAVTDFLTKATGGTDIEPGAVDVSPETLEHLFGTVTGALGSFVDRNVSLGAKMLDNSEEITANDLPLARKVIGQNPSWYDKSAYYDRVHQIEQAVNYAKGYIEREDWDRAEIFATDNKKLLTMTAAAKASQKEMRKIRKARRQNDFEKEVGKVDDNVWRERRDLVRDAEDRAIKRFNTFWNARLYPKDDKAE